MSTFSIIFRAVLALAVAVFGAWYLAVNSMSWPTDGGPGVPEGYRRLSDSAEVTAHGTVQPRPPEFALDSLEGAHRLYLAFLNEKAPAHLRFDLPTTEELRRSALELRSTRDLVPPTLETRVLPGPKPRRPHGRVDLDRLLFEWNGTIGELLQLEVTREETGTAVHRFRVSGSAAWYPYDGPPLERGRSFSYRLVWDGGASPSISFQVASNEEQRAYESARRSLEQVSMPRLRSELEVLLARADGRDSAALERVQRAKLQHPESELLKALEEELEARIDN